MILSSLNVDRAAFEARTGWELKPEGACKGAVCVPLREGTIGSQLDSRSISEQLHMPLVHDEATGTWALGPAALGRALNDARLPDIVLPDVDGRPFALSSLRGQKVFLLAWASW